MKSIFKKIAFVLALAMVVTMFPVMNASAANVKDNKYARKRNATLFVGGDITGDYVGCWAAQTKTKTWMKEEGYKSAYKSSDETVVTVSKYGYVEAVGVGMATITATFSKGGDSIVETFDVTVKKNADKVALDVESEAALKEELSVGDKYTLKANMTDADGNIDSTITDTIKFYMSSKEEKEIIDLNSTTGEFTALKEGKATILVRSYQWAYDRETGKNVSKMTAESKYEVEVKNKMAAQQSAFNAFTITFATEEIAKAAVDETSKYLNTPAAAVTEKKDIIKVYEVLKNTKEDINETAVIIGGLSRSGNVVTVRMFDELKEDTDYVIRYMDQTATERTTMNIAEKLTVNGEHGETITEDSSRSDIVVRIFAKGTKGQDVDITECRKYRGWQDSVTITDISSNRSGYNLIIGKKVNFDENKNETVTANAEVYFYNKTASVRVKAEFYDYISFSTGKTLPAENTISASDRGYVDGELINWGIVDEPTAHDKGAFSVHKLAAEDFGKQLAVQARITYKNAASDEPCNFHRTPSLFTFKTQNEDKLIVNEATGALFPAKVPQNTIVNVYVYYDGHYVGYCPVEILAKRELTGFTMNVNGNTKLSYNKEYDVDDIIEVELKPVDQLGDVFTTNMSVNVKMYGITSNTAYLKDYLKFYGEKTCTSQPLPISTDGQLSVNLTADGTYKVWIKGTSSLPKAVRDIRLLGTATYIDNVNQKSLNAATNFTAKNTYGETARTYQINTNAKDNSVDMKLDGRNLSDTKVTIQAYSIDRDGFKIKHLALTAANGNALNKSGNEITVNLFNDYKGSDYLKPQGNGYDLVFSTVVNSPVSAVSPSAIGNIALSAFQKTGYIDYTIASGSAITNTVTDGNLLEKIQKGNYQVTLYVDGAYKAGSVIAVNDSETIDWTWENRSLEYPVNDIIDIVSAIQDAFDFAGDPDPDIYAGHIEEIKDADGAKTGYRLMLKDDFVVQGEYVSVKQVRCLRQSGSYYYEVIIPINRSLKVVVIH